MIKRIAGTAALAATVVAALALAGPAGAGANTGAYLVSGSAVLGQFSGSLEGQMTETPGTFESFLATRNLTPSGIVTWRAPTVFTGCVDGDRCGRLFLDGHYRYRFQPGTQYYDFELGGYQPGTIGDPAVWISGGSVARIVGGDGELAGASGVLLITETAFLTEHIYRGVVNL